MDTRIVFLDADSVGDVEILNELNRFGKYTQYGLTRPDERIERIKGHSIVITNKVVINREVMDSCPDLRLVCIAATGMNNVDLEYAERKGIVVRNVAGYSTESVAQSTFSMLFYLMHSSAYYDKYVKDGSYTESPMFTHHGREFSELKGKTWGIIGLGTIGKRVAELADAFKCRVIYYSTSGKNLEAHYPHFQMEELLQASDIITVHCPLNEKTVDLITESELRTMKPGAYLLNMGRGGIVNEAALTHALDEEWIAGAGVDVLTEEPIAKTNPLLSCKHPERLYITPHIAWASRESRKLLVRQLIRNIEDFLGS